MSIYLICKSQINSLEEEEEVLVIAKVELNHDPLKLLSLLSISWSLKAYDQLIKLTLWRACNLTTFIHSSTGPVVHPFASCHEGPGFNPQGGTYAHVKPGFSC
jgi:hypothetical protein